MAEVGTSTNTKKEAAAAAKAERKRIAAATKNEAAAAESAERKQIKSLKQYLYGLIVVLGGFILGTAIGWSSPAERMLERQGITKDEFKWVASIMPLGAALSQLIAMPVMDWIGRKWALWVLCIMNVASWALLTIKVHVVMLIIGRFLQGLSSGGFCTVCPSYIGEVADKFRRGALGVCFQLFLVIGIEVIFTVGMFESYLFLNLVGSCCTVLTIILILFIPESPYYYLSKNKEEKATKVMQIVRGKEYDAKNELDEMKKSQEKSTSTWKEMKKSVNIKAFTVLLILHVVQQLSGINAVLYYAHSIFLDTGSSFSENFSVLMLGGAQVAMTLVAALLVDRAGRRLLFMVSLLSMAATIGLVGIYFTVKREDEESATSMAILPTIAVVLYICGYSIGVGPLPWAMIGEYFSGHLKTKLGMTVSFTNWMLAFLITLVFPILQKSIKSYVDFIFYFFGASCILGFFFVFIFVVETSKKTLEQIHYDIENFKATGLNTEIFKKKKKDTT